MALALSQWRPRHLLRAWGGYWAALAAGTLAPAAAAVWQVWRPGGHGNISASFSDSALQLSVAAEGATAWTGSADLLTVALVVAGPPLLLWIVWLALRSRRRVAAADALGHPVPDALSGATRAALPPHAMRGFDGIDGMAGIAPARATPRPASRGRDHAD